MKRVTGGGGTAAGRAASHIAAIEAAAIASPAAIAIGARTPRTGGARRVTPAGASSMM